MKNSVLDRRRKGRRTQLEKKKLFLGIAGPPLYGVVYPLTPPLDGTGITLYSYSPLGTLRQAGLKLQTAKCNFCQPEVRFLEHIISAKGVAADPDKTKVISNWPTPTDKRHVQQFLGLVNYYRRFIKNFSSIAKPLHRLTEKNTTFQWSTLCQKAVDELHRCLVSSPILVIPDSSFWIQMAVCQA